MRRLPNLGGDYGWILTLHVITRASSTGNIWIIYSFRPLVLRYSIKVLMMNSKILSKLTDVNWSILFLESSLFSCTSSLNLSTFGRRSFVYIIDILVCFNDCIVDWISESQSLSTSFTIGLRVCNWAFHECITTDFWNLLIVGRPKEFLSGSRCHCNTSSFFLASLNNFFIS